MADEHKVPTCADYVAEVRLKHNDICISTCTDSLCRLVGIHFDESDVYHIVRYPATHDEEARTEYDTMVGACESVKGLRSHAYLDGSFARGGCPPSDEFIVTADTRDQFAEAAAAGLDHDHDLRAEYVAKALGHYDRDIAPLLAANAPGVAPLSPWQAHREKVAEAAALLTAAHPGYGPAVAELHWAGVEAGVDTYMNFAHGKVVATFDRGTGVVRGPDWDRSNGQPLPEWTEDPARVLGQFMPDRFRRTAAPEE